MKDFYINTQINPKGLKKDEYDVIIIGAGIGGLVCGCYLAKAGMKVLIVEQHHKPGGYCQSFSKEGFIFDVCVHSLGSCRQGGQLNKILGELSLGKRLIIKRANPSDGIVVDRYKILIENDVKATV
jgi:protoporphyrinogen oxidase